ncbi:PREDICTED: ATP synthase subunit alpha, mitochondrial-like [Wasmannia auropunctata]|uniref:ATP synthase subunit alpha, mitochondrial-like n=1 Tax=Wasmannia auropunctata TaxID=64793 RepID=UPI0005EE5768|nr:PREDICTED: ATP synthase subunit alpha, mitochondrial-like [Wasmannia auropunctata]
MALLSLRLASSLARHLPNTTAQINWPAITIVSRKYHVSCSRRSAEISAILEERILGTAPKVSYNLVREINCHVI